MNKCYAPSQTIVQARDNVMRGLKWLVTVAFIVPASYGLYLVVSVWTLPKLSDGEVHDGTPAIVGLFFLFVVAPATALLSSLIVLFLTWLMQKWPKN